jgi:hypothetical protein
MLMFAISQFKCILIVERLALPLARESTDIDKPNDHIFIIKNLAGHAGDYHRG